MRGQKSQKPKWSKIGLNISIPVAVLLTILQIILRTEACMDRINVAFGIRTYKRICATVNWVVAAAVLALVICEIGLVRGILAQKQSQKRKHTEQRRREQLLAEYAESGCSPEMTRRVFNEIIDDGAEATKKLVETCCEQMTAVDEFQDKQRLLLASNNAAYLEEVIDVVNDAETSLCQNLHGVINICITTREANKMNLDAVDVYLKKNATLIEYIEKLLTESTAWVNSRNNRGQRDGCEVRLKNLTEAIKQELEEVVE